MGVARVGMARVGVAAAAALTGGGAGLAGELVWAGRRALRARSFP